MGSSKWSEILDPKKKKYLALIKLSIKYFLCIAKKCGVYVIYTPASCCLGPLGINDFNIGSYLTDQIWNKNTRALNSFRWFTTELILYFQSLLFFPQLILCFAEKVVCLISVITTCICENDTLMRSRHISEQWVRSHLQVQGFRAQQCLFYHAKPKLSSWVVSFVHGHERFPFSYPVFFKRKANPACSSS